MRAVKHSKRRVGTSVIQMQPRSSLLDSVNVSMVFSCVLIVLAISLNPGGCALGDSLIPHPGRQLVATEFMLRPHDVVSALEIAQASMGLLVKSHNAALQQLKTAITQVVGHAM